MSDLFEPTFSNVPPVPNFLLPAVGTTAPTTVPPSSVGTSWMAQGDNRGMVSAVQIAQTTCNLSLYVWCPALNIWLLVGTIAAAQYAIVSWLIEPRQKFIVVSSIALAAGQCALGGVTGKQGV